MTVSISKKSFRVLIGLTKKQPWLEERMDALVQLIYKDCSSQEQKDLILELLYRFEYMSSKKFNDVLNTMAEEIVTDPDLEDETTQLVAMAADSSADSSQYILYALKVIFQKLGWEKYKQTNNFGRAYKSYKNRNNFKNLVLIDEFVGSGKTVLSRVKEIRRVFDGNGISDYSIRVRCLVSAESGVKAIADEGIDFMTQIILKKGISGYQTWCVVKNQINLMLSLESILKKEYGGHSLPSLGYGGVESLYCRESGNTPNSVFPIFWWPAYSDESKRSTVLIRAMGDA